MRSADAVADPAVRLAGVTVRYPRGTVALEDVSLTVAPRERVALVGPSGAGKSTLVNLLNGRVLVDGAAVTGDVEVLGATVSHLRPRARRALAARVGTIRQSLDLVGPMEVVHNVNAGRLAAWGTGRALWSLVRPGGVDAAAELLATVGLDPDLVRVRVDQLSGGQQQRVAIARLLAQRPELVVADEPVASLDPELSGVVLGLLADPPAASGWTLIVSLHQPDLARRFADRVVGLREGRVEFDVPAGSLDDARLAALYGR